MLARLMSVLALMLMGAHAQGDGGQPIMAGGRIGPIVVGMTSANLEALGLPFVQQEINWEGDLYPQYVIEFTENSQVIATLFNDVVWDVTTHSALFVTPEGARVGDTLAELRTIYPSGRDVIGFADGIFFNFVLPGQSHAIFMIDKTSLGNDCIDYRRNCPDDLDQRRSISFFAR